MRIHFGKILDLSFGGSKREKKWRTNLEKLFSPVCRFTFVAHIHHAVTGR